MFVDNSDRDNINLFYDCFFIKEQNQHSGIEKLFCHGEHISYLFIFAPAIFLPYGFLFFNSKFILTGLARRLVVCVSPNYLRLVDREHQTSGGDYHPQPSTRYHNCKIQMTTKTNTETENTTENIRSP